MSFVLIASAPSPTAGISGGDLQECQSIQDQVHPDDPEMQYFRNGAATSDMQEEMQMQEDVTYSDATEDGLYGFSSNFIKHMKCKHPMSNILCFSVLVFFAAMLVKSILY